MTNPKKSVVLSSFGILGETLAPAKAKLPTAANPYLVQGYFVQVSYYSETGPSIDLTLSLFDKGDFFIPPAPKPQPAVLLDIVLNDKVPKKLTTPSPIASPLTLDTTSLFPTTSPPTGLENGDTVVFGIQALPTAAAGTEAPAYTPEYTPNFGWHGYSKLTATSTSSSAMSGSLIVTATQRLVYYDTPALGTVTNSTVYSLPIAGGNPEISLS